MVIYLQHAKHRIHIIDPDYRRRARVALEVNYRGLHAEIYEDVDEFSRDSPQHGSILFADGLSDNVRFNQLTAALSLADSPLPIVCFASGPSTDQVVAAMSSGAFDYLDWPFNPVLLDATLQRLIVEAERRVDRRGLILAAKASVEKLSPRERQVLAHLASGMSSVDVSMALKISPRTVEIHRANLKRKLKAKSVSAAVRIAMYAGLDKDFHPMQ